MTNVSNALPLVVIDGQFVNIATLSDATTRIMGRLEIPASFLVCTLNLDHLVKLRYDAGFRHAYRQAEFITADGFPIVTLARLHGVNIERTTGSDLIEPLCRQAARLHMPVFLFGTTFEALCASARRLAASCPGLEINGVFAPPADFAVRSPAADEAIAQIRDSGARICFVALGAPLQERFAARAIAETSGVAFMPIGGGLDFLAGTQVRCPRSLQRLNLEWAWRLAHNPRRFVARYVRCAVLFGLLLLEGLMAYPSRRQGSA